MKLNWKPCVVERKILPSSEKLGICGVIIERRVKTNIGGATNSEPENCWAFPKLF
jgi:hypothetical protein